MGATPHSGVRAGSVRVPELLAQEMPHRQHRTEDRQQDTEHGQHRHPVDERFCVLGGLLGVGDDLIGRYDLSALQRFGRKEGEEPVDELQDAVEQPSHTLHHNVVQKQLQHRHDPAKVNGRRSRLCTGNHNTAAEQERPCTHRRQHAAGKQQIARPGGDLRVLPGGAVEPHQKHRCRRCKGQGRRKHRVGVPQQHCHCKEGPYPAEPAQALGLPHRRKGKIAGVGQQHRVDCRREVAELVRPCRQEKQRRRAQGRKSGAEGTAALKAGGQTKAEGRPDQHQRHGCPTEAGSKKARKGIVKAQITCQAQGM